MPETKRCKDECRLSPAAQTTWGNLLAHRTRAGPWMGVRSHTHTHIHTHTHTHTHTQFSLQIQKNRELDRKTCTHTYTPLSYKHTQRKHIMHIYNNKHLFTYYTYQQRHNPTQNKHKAQEDRGEGRILTVLNTR